MRVLGISTIITPSFTGRQPEKEGGIYDLPAATLEVSQDIPRRILHSPELDSQDLLLLGGVERNRTTDGAGSYYVGERVGCVGSGGQRVDDVDWRRIIMNQIVS